MRTLRALRLAHESTGERILKVKKPDYLGSSKWGFRYGSHTIEARITDQLWLARFGLYTLTGLPVTLRHSKVSGKTESS